MGIARWYGVMLLAIIGMTMAAARVAQNGDELGACGALPRHE